MASSIVVVEISPRQPACRGLRVEMTVSRELVKKGFREMASRRLEKVSKSIQGTVSEVISNHLSDPRIKGMISVTRVDPAPDLRSAKIYLSILGVSETQEKLSITGIKSASGYIRTCLARRLTMKMCPALEFILDEGLKKSFETMQLLNQVSRDISGRDPLTQDVSGLEENEPSAEI